MIHYKLAEQLHFNYVNAHPFPHIVIDNFLDKGIATKASNDLIKYDKWDYDPTSHSSIAQINKFFSPSISLINFAELSISYCKHSLNFPKEAHDDKSLIFSCTCSYSPQEGTPFP